MRFFKKGLTAIEIAQKLIAMQEARIKFLESENLRLIGIAYPLNGPCRCADRKTDG